jgi:hypothetical protein
MNLERYLFRRQFVSGPEKIAVFTDWNTTVLPDGRYVSTHPDLEIHLATDGDNYLFLLGYLLDPLNPESTNAVIIETTLVKCAAMHEVFSIFNGFGGRYVVMAKINGDSFIFSDPSGFRQLFYIYSKSSGFWCGSQPSILAEHLNLTIDPDTNNKLLNTKLFLKTTEYWYPGTLSAYKNVFRLIPNHYLDIRGGIQKRYWPLEPVASVNLEDGVRVGSQLLEGLLAGLSMRYNVGLTITAGLDSRVVLAASKKVSSQIYYMTHTHHGLDYSGSDIPIPSIMLPELGLKHNIIYHSSSINKEFELVFNRNISKARIEKGINAYAFFNYFKDIGKEYTVVNGVCGEICRQFYFLPSYVKINKYSLAGLAGMKDSVLAVSQFDSWLKDLQFFKSDTVSLLDLFYWEQRIGSWAAMSYNEYDIAFESFSPFNCRKLLEVFLGIDVRYRCGPSYILFNELIKAMWPETLNFEINPLRTRKARLMRSFKRSWIHGLMKSIKYFSFG